MTSGDYNIAFGKDAGDNITSGSGNVVIGIADVSSATGDDQLSISDGEDGSVVWMTGDSSGNLTFTGVLDVNGTADAIVLDADADTTISSPTDDQIDFEIAGADDFTMTANTFTILSGSTIAIAAGGAITNAGSMAPDITSTGKALVFGF